MAGTVCTYNGITLSMVKTLSIDQSPERDPSGTDVLWFAHIIRTESIFSILDNGGLPNHVPGETTPHAIMARLKHMLEVPRKPFLYGGGPGGGDALFDIPDGLDAANGPTPLRCDIVKLTDNTFTVHWDVKVCLADCDDNRQRFASNRWDQEQSIDSKGFSTLTTTGEVVVRSDMQINPDQLRGITVPPLLNDFVREISFEVSRDGLKLQYRFVDTQKYLLPPLGCTVLDGDFGITTQNFGAYSATVSITLEGQKGLPKRDLMAMAMLMAVTRLEAAGPVGGNRQRMVFKDAAWRESLSENRISIALTTVLADTSTLFATDKSYAFVRDNTGVRGVRGQLGLAIDVAKLGTKSAAERKQALADARAILKAQAQAQTAALLANPPWERIGDPLALTATDSDGLDPGLRGNLPFLSMVAAAFRDPCVKDAAGFVRGNLKDSTLRKGGDGPFLAGKGSVAQSAFQDPDPQADDIKAGQKMLRNARAGTSTLRTFAVVDNLSLYQREVGKSGADEFTGVYGSWICDVEHDLDSNQDVCERTVDGQPGAQVRWANAGRTITVRWSAEKYGYAPEYPVCLDDNLIHIRTKISPQSPTLAADGITFIYRASGVSQYKALDPNGVIVCPFVPPWVKDPGDALLGPVPRSVDTAPAGQVVGKLTLVPGIPPVNP